MPLLKEMLLTLDLARVAGSPADRRAADRLQRRLLHDDLKESGLLPVGAGGLQMRGGVSIGLGVPARRQESRLCRWVWARHGMSHQQLHSSFQPWLQSLPVCALPSPPPLRRRFWRA